MPHFLQILARSEDESWVKVVIGAVVVVFWLVSALVSAINKKAEENKRRQSYGQLPQGLATIAQPPPLRRVSQPIAAPKAKPAQRPPQRQAFATASAPIEAMPSSNLNRVAVATQVTQKQPATKVVPPNQIGRLLQRSDTLRAAFILNEVLTPPLSLRDGPGGRGHV